MMKSLKEHFLTAYDIIFDCDNFTMFGFKFYKEGRQHPDMLIHYMDGPPMAFHIWDKWYAPEDVFAEESTGAILQTNFDIEVIADDIHKRP